MIEPGPGQSSHRLLLEWFSVTVGLAALAIWLGAGPPHSVGGALARADAIAFDTINRSFDVPGLEQIVLVEIDEDSLAQVGRWPWPRKIHAAAIERLGAAGARVIGLDVLLIEGHEDDAVLAQAMEKHSPVVLPIGSGRDATGSEGPIYPVPELGKRASFGHVQLKLDEDGAVRGLFLVEGGFAAFPLAMAAAAKAPIADRTARLALRDDNQAARDRAVARAIWPRQHFVFLPSLQSVITRVSYGSLMRGETPPGLFKDALVLIGATATGLGDQYATPSLRAYRATQGVDIHAAALNGLLRNRLINRAPGWIQAVFALVFVATTMGLLYRLTPRWGLPLVATSAALAITVATIALRLGTWIPPAATLMSLAIAYPLWNWRRLQAAVAGLAAEARALAAEPDLFGAPLAGPQPAEPIARRLSALHSAASRLRGMRRFFSQVVEHLPHPVLVADAAGRTLKANAAARSVFSPPPPEGKSVWPWLGRVFGIRAGTEGEGPLIQGASECRDSTGRSWMIDIRMLSEEPNNDAWLIQFTEVTGLRQTQREREQTLQFLSEGLRTPHERILDDLEQMKNNPGEVADLTRIQRHARIALERVDAFAQLLRGLTDPIRLAPSNLSDLLTDAIDACWHQASLRSIRIISQGPDNAQVDADPALLRQAITNLISRAVTFSPDGATVEVALQASVNPEPQVLSRGSAWCISVVDHGPPVAPPTIVRMFEPFWSSTLPLPNETEEIIDQAAGSMRNYGLSLTFVREVVLRHGGVVRAMSLQPAGVQFELYLPTTSPL